MPASLFPVNSIPADTPEFFLSQNWIEVISTPMALLAIGVGIFGLLVGFLLAYRPRPTVEEPKKEAIEMEDLKWRHEKLVLSERQEVERQKRLETFADGFCDLEENRLAKVKARWFVLGERIREERQRVGSGLSRIRLLRKHLDDIGDDEKPSGTRELADTHFLRLEDSQTNLRTSMEIVSLIEEELNTTAQWDESLEERVRAGLDRLDGMVGGALQNLTSTRNDTEQQIRDVLEAEDNPKLRSIRQILLVDGANSSSLADRETPLADALAKVRAALEGTAPEPKQTPEPDYEFKSPILAAAFATDTNEEPVEKVESEPVATPEVSDESEQLVVFRSNNPKLWGETIYKGANNRSRSFGELPDWVNWISLQRTDTGERVFAPADSSNFTKGNPGVPSGFNGTGELFYGACHLGMFSETCPNEVETRFTYGGWGFGHRVNESNRDSNGDGESLQASGWEGTEISGDTVFEIMFHSERPDLKETDRVLEG